MNSETPVPEFSYACRCFQVSLQAMLNGIERKHEEFFHRKRAELLAEIDQLKSGIHATNRKRTNHLPTDTDDSEDVRKKRLEMLRQEFKTYSENIYDSATARLRSDALATRAQALEHYRARMQGDEESVQALADALDEMLGVSTLDRTKLFNNPLFHEGFCRLNPIDLTK